MVTLSLPEPGTSQWLARYGIDTLTPRSNVDHYFGIVILVGSLAPFLPPAKHCNRFLVSQSSD